MNIKEYLEKRRYKTILHDRRYLTDYEKEQLIPEIKSRLKVLAQYFKEIIKLCDVQKDSKEFNLSLNSIINPKAAPISLQQSGQSVSEKFFGDVKLQAQEEGVDDIE